MIRPLFRTLIWAAGCVVSGGASEVPPLTEIAAARWNVRVDVQMVAVARDDAPPLIKRVQDPRQAEGAADALQTMLATGKAELLAWPVAWAANGSRAVAETINEVRYPMDEPSLARGLRSVFAATFHSGVPEGFETRNVGAVLEIGAAVHPAGGSVDLDIGPQWVKLGEFHTRRLDRTRGGLRTFVEQPDFHVQRVTTSLTVRSGERRFLGIFHGPKPDDKVTFFILRAAVIPVAPAASSK